MFAKLFLATSIAGLMLTAAAAPLDSGATQRLYPADQLQQDFRFLQKAIADTHPDPGFSIAPGTLAQAYKTVEAQLNKSMTSDDAWRTMAALNPVFADAHLLINQPDWAKQTQAHRSAGGLLFPYEVFVDTAGDLFIRSALGGGASPHATARIDQINGIPARQVSSALLALTPGDTPALRAHLLARRLWLSYWKVYGAPRRFDLTITMPNAKAQTLRVAASDAEPAAIGEAANTDFARNFHFEQRPGSVGILTIKQFWWPDKAAFHAFTHSVFTTLREARTAHLIIDIRDNTGGDDDMWKEGLLRYIADKPYRHGSTYIKKVIAGRASGTEQVGDVVPGTVDSWVQPEMDNPLHFSGSTYVLVGRLTYSSSILFSNVVQDFGFGKLVGAAGYARTRQSGGIQSLRLPNTGLGVVVPRFILDRPSGLRDPALVRPDIVLPDSPFNQHELVDALLSQLRAAGPAKK